MALTASFAFDTAIEALLWLACGHELHVLEKEARDLARMRTPEGDFRAGEMEHLPWTDNTFDVVNGRLEKPIPGFGELFRMLSYEQVGAAAMLSRAVAGLDEREQAAELRASQRSGSG